MQNKVPLSPSRIYYHKSLIELNYSKGFHFSFFQLLNEWNILEKYNNGNQEYTQGM